jgi:hypothetical protein
MAVPWAATSPGRKHLEIVPARLPAEHDHAGMLKLDPALPLSSVNDPLGLAAVSDIGTCLHCVPPAPES